MVPSDHSGIRKYINIKLVFKSNQIKLYYSSNGGRLVRHTGLWSYVMLRPPHTNLIAECGSILYSDFIAECSKYIIRCIFADKLTEIGNWGIVQGRLLEFGEKFQEE